MGYRKKDFPMGGDNTWATTDMIICRSFRIDCGAQAAGTATTERFKAGSVIFAFRAKVTETVSGTTSTVQLGFTGTTMLSAATAEATLVANYIFGNANNIDACVMVLSTDDTFDCIVGVNTLTAGKFDVDVYYAPPPEGVLGAEFKQYTTE